MNKVNRIAIGMTVIVRGECTYDIDTGEPNILVRDLAGDEKKTPRRHFLIVKSMFDSI